VVGLEFSIAPNIGWVKILYYVTFSGSDYRYEVFAVKYIPYVSLYLMLTLQKFTVMAKKLGHTMPFFPAYLRLKANQIKNV
jgi:hypothetical protein